MKNRMSNWKSNTNKYVRVWIVRLKENKSVPLALLLIMALGTVTGIGFYMKNLAGPLGIDMQTIYNSVVPFVVLDIVGLILIMIFPGIALWLVDKMM